MWDEKGSSPHLPQQLEDGQPPAALLLYRLGWHDWGWWSLSLGNKLVIGKRGAGPGGAMGTFTALPARTVCRLLAV